MKKMSEFVFLLGISGIGLISMNMKKQLSKADDGFLTRTSASVGT